MPGPIRSRSKKFCKPLTNTFRRRHRKPEQDNTAVSSERRLARQFSEVFVESQQDAPFPRGAGKHIRIFHAGRHVAYPDNVMTGISKRRYCGGREILVCEKSYPQAAGKTLSELSTSRA